MRFDVRKMLAVLVILTLASSVYAAVPAVLQEIPADATVVVATQPLAELSAKIDLLAHQYQIAPPEQSINIQTLIAEQFSVTNLDPTQGIGLAMFDLQKDEPTVIFYLPVTDAAAALAGLQMSQGAVPDLAAPTVLHLPDKGVYVTVSGKYLVLGESAGILAKLPLKTKGIKLSAAAGPLFADSLCAAWINLAAITPLLKEKIIEGANSMAAAEMTPAQPAGPGLSPQAKLNLIKKCLIWVGERLGDLDEAAAGLKCLQDGFNISVYVHAKPGSQLAAAMSNHPPADPANLKNLPNGDFNFATVANSNPDSCKPIVLSLFDAVTADPELAQKLDPAVIAELKTLIPQLIMAQACSADYLANASPAAGTAPAKKSVAIYNSPDAEVKLKNLQRASELLTTCMAAMGANITVGYKSQAGVAAEKPYDELTLDLSQMPMAPEQKQMIMMQWGGKLAQSFLLCKMDNQRIMLAADKQYLPEFLAYTPGGTNGLDQNPDIVKTAKNLPPKANAYMYFNVANGLRSMMAQPGIPPMAMMMFGPLTQMPGTIGASVAIENGYALGNTYIPGELVQAAVGFFMQMQMQMQQMQTQPGMSPMPGEDESESPAPEGPAPQPTF